MRLDLDDAIIRRRLRQKLEFLVRVAVRVAGSWIAAIGLLLLGWSLRAGRG